jgi:hypothetical protein
MPAAALPAGAQDAGDRETQPIIGVGDHQLDAFAATLDQALEKSRPERFCSEGPMPSPMISRRPSALTAPAIIAAPETMRPPSRPFRSVASSQRCGPFAVNRPVEAGLDPFVDILDRFETWRFEMPDRPIAWTSSSTRRVDTPPIWVTLTSAFSGGLARLRKRREAGALAPLGNAQAERTEPGVEAAVAVAIARVEPVSAALVPAGPDQPCDIGFHWDLQHRRRHGSQEIAIAALLR